MFGINFFGNGDQDLGYKIFLLPFLKHQKYLNYTVMNHMELMELFTRENIEMI